ncbi:MAG: restriction endonuclease [Pseudomonadota bacterium]
MTDPIFVFADNSTIDFRNTERQYGTNDGWENTDTLRAIRQSVYSSNCPYCGIECTCEWDNAIWGVTGDVTDRFSFCDRCGWWSYESEAWDTDGNGTHYSIAAILRRFQHSDDDVPIDALISYIAANESSIREIRPAKLEEMVGAIYSESLGYRVEFCSYARPDRGIDLIVVCSDGGYSAIQVKRRKRPIVLGEIHQFFGAMVDSGFREGFFVTSGKFRSGARDVASSLRKRTGIRIDLVDGKRLLEFIGVLGGKDQSKRAADFDFWRSHPYFGDRQS